MESLDLHISEEDLEAYALQRADDYLVDAIEDHLLLCPTCRKALDQLEDDLELMRLLLK